MALTIKQWRRVKGITQEELATSLSVHPNTIAEWENNPKKIQIGWAYKICRALGITFEDVIFLPEDSTNM